MLNNRYIEIIKKENGASGRMYLEKYVSKNYPEIFNAIIAFCEGKLCNLPFKEKVYHYVNDIQDIVYCSNLNCHSLVKFKNSTIGYYKYCSNRCIGSDPEIKKIKEEKSYKKYGTKAPAMNIDIKEKTKKTNLKKYGFEYASMNEEIKEKTKKTTIEKYGVENVMYLDEVKLKLREKMIKKWGVNSYFKTTEFKESKLYKLFLDEDYRKNNFIIGKHNNYVKYIGDNIF